MIVWYDKEELRTTYHGDLNAMREAGDGLVWDERRIESAFRFGHGTYEDLFESMRNNQEFNIYVDEPLGVLIECKYLD